MYCDKGKNTDSGYYMPKMAEMGKASINFADSLNISLYELDSELPRPQGGASKKLESGGIASPHPRSAFIPVHRTGYSAVGFHKYRGMNE